MTSRPEDALPADQHFSPEEVEMVLRRDVDTMKWAEEQFHPSEFKPDAETRKRPAAN